MWITPLHLRRRSELKRPPRLILQQNYRKIFEAHRDKQNYINCLHLSWFPKQSGTVRFITSRWSASGRPTSYPWSNGKSLIWDVTVKKCGSAADQAERDKHNNYRELHQHYVCTPLAFESFGSLAPETELYLIKLGKLMKKHSGEPGSLDYLLQRISIAIQRGNAICIRETFCDNDEFNVFLWNFCSFILVLFLYILYLILFVKFLYICKL